MKTPLTNLAFALAVPASLGACTATPAAAPIQSVTVRGAIGLPAPAFRVQTVEGPTSSDPKKAYDAAAVTKVEIFLSRGTEAFTSLGSLTSTAGVIAITNLRMDTSYRVRLDAYAGSERIDTEDDACITAITTTKDMSIEDVKFKLALEDQTFSGTSQGSIELTEGGLTDTTAAPALVQPD